MNIQPAPLNFQITTMFNPINIELRILFIDTFAWYLLCDHPTWRTEIDNIRVKILNNVDINLISCLQKPLIWGMELWAASYWN